MTGSQAMAKRTFDVALSLVGLMLTGWLTLIAAVVATIDTRQAGIFVQERIGRHGKPFPLFKVRTMRDVPGHDTNVTTAADPRITTIGRVLRRSKIDELPQLVNVLVGHMSFVGPRPDVAGFADKLEGEDRIILTVRPGITGPASLKYRDEEVLLRDSADPEAYNRDVIYPDKVAINRAYIESYRFGDDVRYLLQTIGVRTSER